MQLARWDTVGEVLGEGVEARVMRVEDLWVRSDGVSSCCCDGGGGVKVLAGSFAGAEMLDDTFASFLLFLKLNFLGGSKAFFMVWSFSERDLMVYFVCVGVSASLYSVFPSCFLFYFCFFSQIETFIPRYMFAGHTQADN